MDLSSCLVGMAIGIVVCILCIKGHEAYRRWDSEQEAKPAEPEFTDSARAALLWLLYHHQGGSSPIGQPIRFALGMGEYDRLSDEQIAQAKMWGALTRARNPSAR